MVVCDGNTVTFRMIVVHFKFNVGTSSCYTFSISSSFHIVQISILIFLLVASLSALIDNRIFSVHGGLSPSITTLDQVG